MSAATIKSVNTYLMNSAVNIINWVFSHALHRLLQHSIDWNSSSSRLSAYLSSFAHIHTHSVAACVLPVLSAALHVRGRAPGWGRARRRAPATHLPCLWRTLCSGRATASLSSLRYVHLPAFKRKAAGGESPFCSSNSSK